MENTCKKKFKPLSKLSKREKAYAVDWAHNENEKERWVNVWTGKIVPKPSSLKNCVIFVENVPDKKAMEWRTVGAKVYCCHPSLIAAYRTKVLEEEKTTDERDAEIIGEYARKYPEKFWLWHANPLKVFARMYKKSVKECARIKARIFAIDKKVDELPKELTRYVELEVDINSEKRTPERLKEKDKKLISDYKVPEEYIKNGVYDLLVELNWAKMDKIRIGKKVCKLSDTYQPVVYNHYLKHFKGLGTGSIAFLFGNKPPTDFDNPGRFKKYYGSCPDGNGSTMKNTTGQKEGEGINGERKAFVAHQLPDQQVRMNLDYRSYYDSCKEFYLSDKKVNKLVNIEDEQSICGNNLNENIGLIKKGTLIKKAVNYSNLKKEAKKVNKETILVKNNGKHVEQQARTKTGQRMLTDIWCVTMQLNGYETNAPHSEDTHIVPAPPVLQPFNPARPPGWIFKTGRLSWNQAPPEIRELHEENSSNNSFINLEMYEEDSHLIMRLQPAVEQTIYKEVKIKIPVKQFNHDYDKFFEILNTSVNNGAKTKKEIEQTFKTAS